MASFGMIEIRSIAKGIETADIMLKSSNISIIKAQMICTGKYIIIIQGDLSSVENAVSKGILHAGKYLINSFVIPFMDKQVSNILTGSHKKPEKYSSLGILECKNIASAVESADIAVKSANVYIVEMKMGFSINGKAVVIITGTNADVKSAVEKSSKFLEDKNYLIEAVVISSADNDLIDRFY